MKSVYTLDIPGTHEMCSLEATVSIATHTI